ncbi:MAG TPA: chitinase [Verrucomicrobiae bacterium]|nr:chitinase [Verrucomicrobiae bacterium]
MRTQILTLPFIAILLVAGCATRQTAKNDHWPNRVFAPYMYAGFNDHFKLTDCDDQSGQKFYTLAFIIANKSNNPAWFGKKNMQQNFYDEQIEKIREHGGDVIISFGGADGKEIAVVETNAQALEAKYQSVIDHYHFTWLDFDIEGKNLENHAANERRNLALANLQRKNPGLMISYTLPVDPNGISTDSQKLLAAAKAKGLKIHSVNIMTMDFGEHFSKGKKMSDVAITSALKAYEQCQAIDPNIQIGLTPDIGQNDIKSEIFTLEDAKTLIDWAKSQPWVCSVSFWCSNRDNGKPSGNAGSNRSGVKQEPWAYTKIFQDFIK